MESRGTEEILKKLVERGIIISKYVHDADSCTSLLMRKYYPNAIEYIDRLHKQRSIKRRMYAQEDKTLKKKDWVERILKFTSIMLFIYCNDIEKKKKHLEIKLKHWKNDHSICENKDCKIQYSSLSSSQLETLRSILQSTITEHNKLNHSLHKLKRSI